MATEPMCGCDGSLRQPEDCREEEREQSSRKRWRERDEGGGMERERGKELENCVEEGCSQS